METPEQQNTHSGKPALLTGEFMDLVEFCEAMCIARTTADRWDRDRSGPPRLKIGGRIYYRRKDVTDWLHRLADEKAEERASIGARRTYGHRRAGRAA